MSISVFLAYVVNLIDLPNAMFVALLGAALAHISRRLSVLTSLTDDLLSFLVVVKASFEVAVVVLSTRKCRLRLAACLEKFMAVFIRIGEFTDVVLEFFIVFVARFNM